MAGCFQRVLALAVFLLPAGAFPATYLDLGWDYKRGGFGGPATLTLQAPWLGVSHYGHGWAVSALAPYLRLSDGSESLSGLGDALTSVSRLVFRGGWSFGVGGSLKWPTGDTDRGLGTGAWDWGLQGAVSHRLGDANRILLQGGYTVVGQAAGADYQDFAAYGIGLLHQRGLLGLSFNYQRRGSSLPDLPQAREVGAGLWYGPGRWQGRLSLVRGLSAGAPELAAGISLSLRL